MDNVTNIEPADNEERLLKGILEGDTETNIEPAGNKERLLKAILENGGGGGATSVTLAASGDNLSGDISLADLKTALSKGVVLLSFPTDGNADERVVAEYTDDSTNGLRIGVFSEDEYIVYSVVDDGNDGVTLTVVSETELGGGGDLTPYVITPTAEGGVPGVPAGTYAGITAAIAAGKRIGVDYSMLLMLPAGSMVAYVDVTYAAGDYVLTWRAENGAQGDISEINWYVATIYSSDGSTFRTGQQRFS